MPFENKVQHHTHKQRNNKRPVQFSKIKILRIDLELRENKLMTKHYFILLQLTGFLTRIWLLVLSCSLIKMFLFSPSDCLQDTLFVSSQEDFMEAGVIFILSCLVFFEHSEFVVQGPLLIVKYSQTLYLQIFLVSFHSENIITYILGSLILSHNSQMLFFPF